MRARRRARRSAQFTFRALPLVSSQVRKRSSNGSVVMQAGWLMVLYALIIIVGVLLVVATGLLVLDRKFPSVSVPVSIFLYFAVFFLGWKLAVRLTAPRP